MHVVFNCLPIKHIETSSPLHDIAMLHLQLASTDLLHSSVSKHDHSFAHIAVSNLLLQHMHKQHSMHNFLYISVNSMRKTVNPSFLMLIAQGQIQEAKLQKAL